MAFAPASLPSPPAPNHTTHRKHTLMTTSSPESSTPPATSSVGIVTGNVTTPSQNPDASVRWRGGLLKLLGWLMPANLGVFLLWGAIPGVLLPLQLTALDAENKVANLAIITTIGALAAMIAQPLAGTFSDRTRSRLGRRAPWMLGGTLIGVLALIGMAIGNSIVMIAIAWVIVQIAFNLVQGPLSAILPDRVPVAARGTFSALLGTAAMLGAVGGQVLGAQFAANIPVGYIVLAIIVLLGIGAFVLFNRDNSLVDDEIAPFRLVDFLRTFWVSPRQHPDFFWAFLGRLLLYTGYFAVSGYNLYLLADYAGLGDAAVGYVAVLGLLQLAGMIPAMLVFGPVSDKVGRRKPFVFASSIIAGVGLLFPLIMPNLQGMMLMAVICGFGFGAFQAVDQALITQVLPSKDSYAKDLGVVNIAATLPQTLAPAVGGAIVLIAGYAGLFPVGFALAVLGAVCVFQIRSVR